MTLTTKGFEYVTSGLGAPGKNVGPNPCVIVEVVVEFHAPDHSR